MSVGLGVFIIRSESNQLFISRKKPLSDMAVLVSGLNIDIIDLVFIKPQIVTYVSCYNYN